MSLYQSYRPRDFSTVVGQEFAKTALANACRLDKIHHGYIMHGSHGIGKTTLARILAKAVNCTNLTEDGNPCHTCENCQAFDAGKMIDVVEIDAASHTGVDNIRDLIEKAQYQPTRGKYKVYIIDEVHMLSKGAFNALLKILEEPPEHVIFILATTEIHKVPETILSRVLRFDLRKITHTDVVAHLQMIAKKEGIVADEKALEVIAQVTAGGMRDAISLFEQYIIDGKVSYETIASHLHLIDDGFFARLTQAIETHDREKLTGLLAELSDQMGDIKIFLSQMLDYMHRKSVEDLSGKNFALYQRLYWSAHAIFAKLRNSPVPFQAFEMMMYVLVSEESASSPLQEVARDIFGE